MVATVHGLWEGKGRGWYPCADPSNVYPYGGFSMGVSASAHCGGPAALDVAAAKRGSHVSRTLGGGQGGAIGVKEDPGRDGARGE